MSESGVHGMDSSLAVYSVLVDPLMCQSREKHLR